jgi:hypothetical protein
MDTLMLLGVGQVIPKFHPAYLGYEVSLERSRALLNLHVSGKINMSRDLLVSLLDYSCPTHPDLHKVFVKDGDALLPPHFFCQLEHVFLYSLPSRAFYLAHLVSGVCDWGRYKCLEDPAVAADYLAGNRASSLLHNQYKTRGQMKVERDSESLDLSLDSA